VWIPPNDIHFLVVQFPNDILDALPSQTDTSAHGIDFLVSRPDRQLCAKTRFPGDSLDFDRPIIDFRYFQLEQFNDEPRVSAGQYDFRSMRPLFHCLHITTNPLADLVFLGRHAFPVRQQRFVFAQIDDNIGAIKPPDGPANNISDAVLEFGENQLFLSPAKLLHQRLLGILRRNPAESDRSDFHLHLFAYLGIRLDPTCIEY